MFWLSPDQPEECERRLVYYVGSPELFKSYGLDLQGLISEGEMSDEEMGRYLLDFVEDCMPELLQLQLLAVWEDHKSKMWCFTFQDPRGNLTPECYDVRRIKAEKYLRR